MSAPNMAAITASLERSLQNFSLNRHHHHHQTSSTGSNSGFGFGKSATSDSPPPEIHNSDDATLDLNSQISLPYHWEQCLDLKTGEVYYINWRTGMKAKDDPRTSNEFSGEVYSEDDDDDDEDSTYDSDDEGSSTESFLSSSSKFQIQNHVQQIRKDGREKEQTGVLVVAGCKSCLMYVMVPKQVEDCPKCAGQLLHFDRSDDTAYP